MAYSLIAPASGKDATGPKNRVWDFFPLSSKTHPVNRRPSPQPRRKLRPTATKSASGIPYWPSRDPIEEKGGMNLYLFVQNNGLNSADVIGLTSFSGCHSDTITVPTLEQDVTIFSRRAVLTFKASGSKEICTCRDGKSGSFVKSESLAAQASISVDGFIWGGQLPGSGDVYSAWAGVKFGAAISFSLSGKKEFDNGEESKIQVEGNLNSEAGLTAGGEAKAKIGLLALTAGITGEGKAKFNSWKGSAECDSHGCSNFKLAPGTVSFEATFTASFGTFSYSKSKEW